ncbi:uncharacterized protein LOC113297108 isoform X2 [Papaver somniferum]|uniref:uncharacterized protein LOC113297108 isoform X2 n=1 Tax=Papaver somniferum TaxID=3469 RepID=UPI000E6F8DD8|nr:uncharacterized protein LOC113297108 isoform X2 [Papaver somniferum]
MENHGVQDSWTERYVINNGLIADFSVRLVWCFKSGEILFCDDWSGALVLYDPKDGSVRKRHTRKLDFSSSEAFYFESLVHLNSNTYAGRRRRGISRNMNNNRTRLPPRKTGINGCRFKARA